MLLLITPENDVPNETELINAFFELGLEVLHIRKPNKNYAQHLAYITAIDEQYHDRLVLHYQHDIAEDFILKGIHIQEKVRLDLGEDFGLYVARFTTQSYDVSTSFHEPNEILLYKEAPLIYNFSNIAEVKKLGYSGVGVLGGVWSAESPKDAFISILNEVKKHY